MFRTETSKKINFFTKKASDLTDEELDAVSDLFSKNYGRYSSNNPDRKKQNLQISLSKNYYKNHIVNNEYTYVALAYYNNTLVGQAFYVIEESKQGNITWVIQLVVKKEYRRQKIAKKLLFSIWGFSNDYAWGLATTNPLTIKTLEAATLRKVSISKMNDNINAIQQVAQKVHFIKKEDICITDDNATVNSRFYVNHDDIPEFISRYGKNWIFGDLNEGYEWLAFTFRNQELRKLSKKDIDYYINYSEERLKDAYSRMDMANQGWTKNTKTEVDFLEQYIPNKNSIVLDVGCGTGRHIAELYDRGYKNVYGFDFSENLINYAKLNYPEIKDNYQVQDCRKLKFNNKADVIFCLYDVIGSFPDNKNNILILKSCRKYLKKKGKIVCSVMNMELTENICKNKYDVYNDPKRIFKMKPSQIMQKSGDVFNPDTYVIDEKTNLVFRKEMFKGDGFLDSEYIIRDKRYTKNEIEGILKNQGFTVLESRFVSSGKFGSPLKNTDLHAKEILLVCEK